MRLVFQLPASITSVVEAPRLVSFDAEPDPSGVRSHPALDTGNLRCGREPQPDHLRRQRHHAAVVGDDVYVVHPHFADEDPPTFEHVVFE